MSTKDIDHGWNRIQKQFAKASKGTHVVVGVPKATGPRDGSEEPTMAEVAFWNEFGTKNIPERSFLRSTIDENAKAYFDYDKRLMSGVFLGKLTMKRALGLLGERAKADVQAKIRKGPFQDNSDATKAMKKTKRPNKKSAGVIKPLIDTGQLIQSITYEIRGLK